MVVDDGSGGGGYVPPTSPPAMTAPSGPSDTSPSIPSGGGIPADAPAGSDDTAALRLVDLFAQAFGSQKIADKQTGAPLVLQSSPVVSSGGSGSLAGLAIILALAGGAFWLYKHHRGGHGE